jgi:hypothetical protein
MMPNRRLCKLSSCGIVLPGSNGRSRNRDRLEAMAAAAQPSEVHHFGWAGLSSESGLTEAQEDFGEDALWNSSTPANCCEWH